MATKQAKPMSAQRRAARIRVLIDKKTKHVIALADIDRELRLLNRRR